MKGRTFRVVAVLGALGLVAPLTTVVLVRDDAPTLSATAALPACSAEDAAYGAPYGGDLRAVAGSCLWDARVRGGTESFAKVAAQDYGLPPAMPAITKIVDLSKSFTLGDLRHRERAVREGFAELDLDLAGHRHLSVLRRIGLA